MTLNKTIQDYKNIKTNEENKVFNNQSLRCINLKLKNNWSDHRINSNWKNFIIDIINCPEVIRKDVLTCVPIKRKIYKIKIVSTD